MTKKELRKIYKQKRLALTPQEILKLDDLLLIQFQRLAFDSDVHVLMNYFPMLERGEIDTHLFSRYLMHSLPELHVAYPVIDFEASTMRPFLVNDETEIQDNIYSIAEPVDGTLIEAAEIDIVFTPLLAFDSEGYRVGYGKGFYDRFLKQCRSDVISIGFSYFEAVDKIEDANQFDVPLNYCITPQRLYEF
jgi:5-formyltetrahydrofolate cyclo-ligase